ncbi:MAG: glycosyl hydrolase family 28-related protein [Limisphaerales bacterium]
MKRLIALLSSLTLVSLVTAAELPAGTDASDPLIQLGCLDVTKAPYRADPTGRIDSTQAIQRAINDARDHALVCFFPEGTYLISETLSCEQQVRKLDKPRSADRGTQHYWDLSHRVVLFGSTRGKRPVLKLSKDAKGFDDPAHPKIAVWIWAQTRDDAPGKQEPNWGEEQPNISFNHFFRGIDIDIRGHAGAIGIRHSGSQGSALLDSTILAEGAYAGMNNCCGQGGGTYNIEVIGGRHAIVIEPESRFPILTGCVFKGQTAAAITYAKGGSQAPALLVGCLIDSPADAAIDLTTQRAYAGISLVDCVVNLSRGGVIARTAKSENLHLEDTFVRGPATVTTDGTALPATDQWMLIRRFSSHVATAMNLINGVSSSGELRDWSVVPAAPDFAALSRRHYQPGPSFEDRDAVNVKTFGAKGDGTTDDTAAFEKAIATHDRIFVPKGDFRMTGTLHIRRNTQLFGLTATFSSIGLRAGDRRDPLPKKGPMFAVATVDDATAAPGLSLLSVRGRIDWKSGGGDAFLAPGTLMLSGHGGGRFYGVKTLGGPLVVAGVTQPTAFYALNVEREVTNPQSEIKDSAHIRIYYFKVEAGNVQPENEGGANTPVRIARSHDVRIHCMAGRVRRLGDRPMLDIVDSDAVVVTQLKTFQPSSFPHLRETRGQVKHEMPSSQPCALFVRDTRSVSQP